MIRVIAVCLGAVILAGAASALLSAYDLRARQDVSQDEGRILSGPDIGFRVEGFDAAGHPQGTLLVRLNGTWVPAVSSPGFRRAK